MKITNSLVLFIMTSIFISSCGTSSFNLNTQELERYFQTSEISSKLDGNNIHVSVSNSVFVKHEYQKKGAKWTTTESFASMGALIAITQLNNAYNVDTIFFNIKTDNTDETYKYSIANLKKTKSYVDVGRQFLDAWGKEDYIRTQSYLGKEILNIYPSVEGIRNALSPVFSDGPIEKSELIAFKISDGVVGLYINAYYKNDMAQTYIFNFYLSGDAKIVGITVPQ